MERNQVLLFETGCVSGCMLRYSEPPRKTPVIRWLMILFVVDHSTSRPLQNQCVSTQTPFQMCVLQQESSPPFRAPLPPTLSHISRPVTTKSTSGVLCYSTVLLFMPHCYPNFIPPAHSEQPGCLMSGRPCIQAIFNTVHHASTVTIPPTISFHY